MDGEDGRLISLAEPNLAHGFAHKRGARCNDDLGHARVGGRECIGEHTHAFPFLEPEIAYERMHVCLVPEQAHDITGLEHGFARRRQADITSPLQRHRADLVVRLRAQILDVAANETAIGGHDDLKHIALQIVELGQIRHGVGCFGLVRFCLRQHEPAEHNEINNAGCYKDQTDGSHIEQAEQVDLVDTRR